MILIFELTWRARAHVPGNAATIETIARAHPGEEIRVFAEAGHLAALSALLTPSPGAAIGFFPAADPAYLQGKTGIVSARRAAREFATLRRALARVPAGERVFLFLLSATSTAIFAASLLARLDRRIAGVHIGLHGNLNEITGWRSRNPLRRAFDLRSALAARHPPHLRFLVLEEAIRRELARILPAAGARTDVLPLPVNLGEDEGAAPPFAPPWRFGLIGQATRDKGIEVFLEIARRMKARFGDRVAFYVIGMIRHDADQAPFAVLAHQPDHGGLTREAFTARLAAMHYILMPLAPEYYALSASGAVIDAVTWRKPMIGFRLPILADLFAEFGDLGTLVDDTDAMATALAEFVENPDPARYARQRAALNAARQTRTPAHLAAGYAALVAEKFPTFR